MNVVERLLNLLPNSRYLSFYDIVEAALEIPEDIQERALQLLRERTCADERDVALLREALRYLNNKLLLCVDLKLRKIGYTLLFKQRDLLSVLKYLKQDIDVDKYADLVDKLIAYLFDLAITHYRDLIDRTWKILLENN